MIKNKKKILILMGRYLPGYKDGGPVRSIKNLTDYLGDEYEFRILTCDRDHGDMQPYPNITVHQWNHMGKAEVYYVPPGKFKYRLILSLSKQVDMIYCCGCFNDYAIHTLLLNRLGFIRIPVVIASMGLFSPLEFRIKYRKKKLFTTCCNIAGLFKTIYWSVTSNMELSEVRQQIKVKDNYFIAEDLPRMIEETYIKKAKVKDTLRVVWFSRIAPKKNLIGAIKVLSQVKSNIFFTIYGPVHDENYWNECKELLSKLPDNIVWEWKGYIESEKVTSTIKNQHVFLFPTLGENYGHVIQEALTAGCPVILSDQTPWNDLERGEAGYSFGVDEYSKYVSVIEQYAAMNQQEFQKVSDKALEYVIKKNEEQVFNTGYRNMFNILCGG